MEYIVKYRADLDGQEHESSMTVEADSAEEACKLVRDILKEETGLDIEDVALTSCAK